MGRTRTPGCRQRDEPAPSPPTQILRSDRAHSRYCNFDLSENKADHVFKAEDLGPGKSELVAGLLDNPGCRRITIESTVGFVPGSNRVHFEPTDEVSEWLRKEWR